MKTRIHPIYGFLSCWALGAMLALSTQTSVRAAGPLVTSVTPILTLEHVRVAFSVSVDPASATNLANYSFTAGSVTLNRATLISTNVVELFTSDQTPGSTNTLQIGGVLDLSSVSMTTTQLDFTTPALTISPLRYDAGTTTTQPSGPSSPASALGGYWVAATLAAGQTVGPVTNDNSTGLNAWNINDPTTTAGTPNYTMNIDTNSGNFGATNGWRIVQCSRVVTNYNNNLTDYWLLYCQKTNRFGIAWGVNAATNLYMAVQGGSTYILTNANWSSYHTNMMVYNPTTKLASIYFDGQLIVDNYAGQGQAGVGSYLIFGNAQGAAAGSMNYNLVQLDVVGATQPVVLLNPASTNLAAGQPATFFAAFTPFVNSYQWLSNGVVIAGATKTNYTTGLLTGGASGAQYICRALSALGNVQTTPATVTVTDTTPLVTSVTPIMTLEHVRVVFSSFSVDPATATNLANYSFTAGSVTLNRATILSNNIVELFTSDQTPGSAHTLQISGIFANGGATMMTTTNFSFTTPNLTISPLRYDAGNTTTQPAGPSSPASALGGYWVAAAPGAGQAVGPVANDNSTGLNAWSIDDNNVVNGGPNPNYTMNIDPNSNAGAPTNGWRIVQRSRVVTNYNNTLTDYWILYDQNGVRFGIACGVNAATNLYMTAVGGSTYTLTSDAFSYHTYMMVYNPAVKKASIYFDGQWIADNYAGQATPGNYLIFGNGQGTAAGSMNYNLMQLDVVGATQPVVLLNPASTNIASGQRATFTAAFTPFVNSYQWLSNGVVIAGATTTNYTTGILTARDNGAQYSLRALSALGNVETTPATLTVPDTAPLVTSVTPILTLEHVRVAFSVAVDPATATNLANYSFTAGPVTMNSATLISPSVVELFTSDQTPGSAHTLQISGIIPNGGIAMMTTTQLNFTTPATLTVSPLRYDAGTTVTQPSGPPDPASAGGGFWSPAISTQPGMTVTPVSDDNSTGLNAWQVSDVNQTASGGSITYTMPVDQPSINLARTNGWRIVVRNRLVSESGSTAVDQVIYYADSATGLRYGPFWWVDGSLNLNTTMLGGSTYTLSSDAYSYHTNIMVYDPVTKLVSYYFDGRLIVGNYAGQAVAGQGLTFGSASSTGKGVMNYNLVQLDVVGATQPVVTLNPISSTHAVGQTATFTAGFTPFVNAFQWFSNSVLIAGATATSYTTPIIELGYNGSQYFCRALSALGNADTTAATLTVTDQTNPPVILSAKGSLLRDRITLVFSQPVSATDMTNIAAYVWVNAGVTNLSAQLIDPSTVELRAGPFLTGSNYTVLVSNIHNLSSVNITNNSPASVTFPTLSSLARYDAGDTNTAPNGPPDPTTPAGGNWSVTSWSDPNLTVSAVTNDTDTGLNAWQVRDASSQYNYANYTQQVATNLQNNARASGWIFTVRGRVPEYLGAAVDQFALVTDYNNNRFALNFNVDANNNLVVGANSGIYTVTTDGSGLGYHLHQVVYDPTTTNVSYYCDGNLIVGGLPAVVVASPSVLWGAASGLAQGTMNYNLVDLSAVDAAFVNIGISGNNAQISYHGVLETTSQLGNPTTWTAVATNLTSTAGVYSVPLNGQQFFRARLP